MKLKDIFNKKVRDEKKKYNFYNLPSYVITSEFLEFFPDEEIRNQIYSTVDQDQNLNFTTKENYNNLIELCKVNKDFGIGVAKSGHVVDKEELENLKELNWYGFNFDMYKSCGKQILIYKEKYGDIVMPYLKENYDLYSNLLNKFNGDIDLKWCLENPSEFDFLKNLDYGKSEIEYLKKFINEERFDDYEKIKELVKNGYNLYILEMLEYYNFDDEIIRLLDSKKIKSEKYILRISSQNINGRNIFNLKCDYEINKCLNENNIKNAIAILNEKYFVSRFRKKIENI